jgi:hypothetical protein
MTFPAAKPDLRRIGESAFQEVLSRLLSWSAAAQTSTGRTLGTDAPPPITGSVSLEGQKVSGTVRIELPEGFVARAVLQLTGLAPAAGGTPLTSDDLAAEIANMVAGRVAALLGTEGYPCRLGIPSVSHKSLGRSETRTGMECGRTELVCEGRPLSIEIQCRYAALV